MGGFDNDVLNCINWDFRGVEPVVAQATSEGILPIGTGGTPAIKAGTIISTDASVTITYSEPDIDLSAGDAVATTYQSQSGSAVPVANILNVSGIQETSTRASGNTVSVFSPRLNSIVVDPTTDNGTATTLVAGLSAASSGDIVFVRPGTYTEDPTIPDGVALVGLVGYGQTETVEIIGKVTVSSGTAYMEGIKVTTNGDNAIAVSGSASFEARLCSFDAADNDLISHTSSGATTFRMCQFDISTTGVKLFDCTAGTLNFRYCTGGNSGGSTTQSTCSGNVQIEQCGFPYPMLTSSTGVIAIRYSRCDTSGTNTTVLTTAGTGSANTVINSIINSGTASDISIGSGTTVQVNNSTLESSNTNAITGAGTVEYGSFVATDSSVINPSSSTPQNLFARQITFNSGGDYLDNYDEGTWTPSIGGAGGNPTVTYNSQLGKYTRIGDMVCCKFLININTYSGGTGNAELDGLPFTSANDSMSVRNNVSTSNVAYPASVLTLSTSIGPNAANGLFTGDKDNAGGVALQVTDIAAGDVFIGEIIYWV